MSSPHPPAGCEHLCNDPGVSVDFNTADPLIRWDSYENLGADGEGTSGCPVSSTVRLGMSLQSAGRLQIPLSLCRCGTHALWVWGCSGDRAWELGLGFDGAVMGAGWAVRPPPRAFVPNAVRLLVAGRPCFRLSLPTLCGVPGTSSGLGPRQLTLGSISFCLSFCCPASAVASEPLFLSPSHANMVSRNM